MSQHEHVPIHQLSSWQHYSIVEIYPIPIPGPRIIRNFPLRGGVVDRVEGLDPVSEPTNYGYTMRYMTYLHRYLSRVRYRIEIHSMLGDGE